MLKTIRRIKLNSMRTEEVHEFNDRAVEILSATCGHMGVVSDQFIEATQNFDHAITAPKPNFADLQELDAKADDAWRALNLQIEASCMHPRVEVRAAAETIADIFSQTPNPTRLNYDQEYGALKTLIQRLLDIPKATRETAWVEEYFVALQAAVEAFTAARFDNLDTRSKQQLGAVKEATQQLQAAWLNLIRHLELQHSLAPTDAIVEAIDKLNLLTVGIQQRLKQRKGREPKEAI